ncbi:UNVERIFIED_CONTAM: hypothetical protein PYX00_001415 [Menopon gallinae]|uniref:Large ribosomal subunit protein mL38 n=1 Tax=Menopon gallinae TaxID=328185 RepID=A0AAW2IDH0_9NEOP
MLRILSRNIKLNDDNVPELARGLRKIPPVPPRFTKSLKERLEEQNYKDPEIYGRVNIGLPRPPNKYDLPDHIKNRIMARVRKDPEKELASRNLELKVDLEQVAVEWFKDDGPLDIYKVADHYGIYSDLFGYAYFVPQVHLEIGFPLPDGNEAPVHRGNVVKPAEALVKPNVRYASKDSTLWTLVLTNPDGHFTEENKEYVHWFVGNIPGNKVNEGEEIWDYLQPFPPRGVGFQRLIFILYKQTEKIDYSELKNEKPRLSLNDRTFHTLEFYRERQNVLTPAGLGFFQTDWDHSVIKTFHEKLNMDEPIFEYDHDQPYVKPQKWFPKKKAFNLYLDKYRDPRLIAKEYVLKKWENKYLPGSELRLKETDWAWEELQIRKKKSMNNA